MRAEAAVFLAGICMLAAGLAAFYSVGQNPGDPALQLARNAGTFVGIAGIGVALAGALLYLVSRGPPPRG
ncbi:MAG: hypothetical protein MPI95_00045 [Nitrosopumilus sp.]|nr:hypothetical protein [Nitrosopumilus sp.]CAI9831389.1 conserved hypothetical protein [Nitrosopumilaceae archaeon]MDA7940875.1 hypothetical protein [Nitrosopumilus sp.]MDA7943269.1 hypothetical protein [Nitrosopumilus sp.]MDA7944238.1 hypothetical protein [Nitrosopumilus sp.]